MLFPICLSLFNTFFSVNTFAAELLYAKVRDWCGITENTTVLGKCYLNDWTIISNVTFRVSEQMKTLLKHVAGGHALGAAKRACASTLEGRKPYSLM